MNHTIFFDLDGTLTDSAPGIIHSVQYALKKYGIEAEENDLRSFIGPPLVHSFQERFGFDHDKALEAVTYYREYFTAGGMFENSVYPGVEEMLQKLKEDGLVLAVATSKPELFLKQILEHFALTRYFDFIGGAAMDESRATKVEVLSYALQELQVDPAKAVMIGDRENDIEAASLLLIRWQGMIEQALEKIEEIKETNPRVYESAKTYITSERVWINYLLYSFYESTFESQDLSSLKSVLYNDITFFGLSKIAEDGSNKALLAKLLA